MVGLNCVLCVFFFFKRKTAYEMLISDWSSDVCSSDLRRRSGPCQDVEHDIGAGDPVRERFGSGALHGVETIDGNRGEDLDHLTVAKIGRASCRERVCQYV